MWALYKFQCEQIFKNLGDVNYIKKLFLILWDVKIII